MSGSATRGAPPYPSPPLVMWQACPIESSLRFLGRKWMLTVLRDIAFLPQASFGQIRKGNPTIRPRSLSLCLGRLAKQGLIRKVVPEGNPRHPYYELTDSGLEIWPILTALFQYGTRNLAGEVFADARPRDLADVYPNDSALMLGELARFARNAPLVRDARGPSRSPSL